MVLNKVRNLFLSLLLVFTYVVSASPTNAFAEELVEQNEIISVIGKDNEVLLDDTNYTYSENTTAFDVLLQTVGEENVEYSESQYGVYIEGINGVKPGENEPYYWAFYINGVSSQVGAGSYVVQEGDRLSFVYTNWEETPENSSSISIIGEQESEILLEPMSVSFIHEPTAFDLLKTAYGVENIEYTTSEYGVMVTGLGGVPQEDPYYWMLYVNDELASVGIDSYKLQNGDQISLRYESWETPSEDPVEEEHEQSEQNEETEKPVEEENRLEPFNKEVFNNSVNLASEYVLENEIGDWQAIALKKAGKTIPNTYLTNLKKQVNDSQGSFARITDYERLTLGILAAGEDPTNFEGYNLVESIYNGNVTKQGLNGVAYALIALDSADFSIPSSAKWNQEKLVNELIKNQNSDGGWSWSGDAASDVDTTAMVLTALAPYQTKVKESIDKAVLYLSNQYQSSKIDNSSTAAQVVIALSALSIDAHSDDFTNEGISLINYLLSFQNKDGGFDWQGGDESDSFSTDQAYRGLVAYQLLGDSSLYHFSLNKGNSPEPIDENEETPQSSEQPDSKEEAPKSADDEESIETINQPNPVEKVDSPSKGNPLPNTATSNYNLIIVGMILVAIGAIVLVYRKQQMNKG